LFFQPQQPGDNPNLGPALADAGITLLASDNSRDPKQRDIGIAQTMPRWPADLFHDVGTVAEEVSEYNWRYAKAADGGSGFCEANHETTTCIAPLDPARGYVDYIVPSVADLVLNHILSNDPRPHYFHQDNLAEDRLLYPLLDAVLARYHAAFAASAPLVQPLFAETSALLAKQTAWKALPANDFDAFVQGGVVKLRTAGNGVPLPLTVPEGSKIGAGTDYAVFGATYGDERSAWVIDRGAPR
jgi:hypothetical protein